MKKLSILLSAAFFLILVVLTTQGNAGMNVNIRIYAPPAYVIEEPPEVVPIPGTYVYFVPDAGVDILFYHGYWYRPNEARWFRARSYNGPWVYIAPRRIPRVLLELPPDYWRGPGEYVYIPYGHFKRNWVRWERERYWDRHRDWRDEDDERHGRHEGERHQYREKEFERHGDDD